VPGARSHLRALAAALLATACTATPAAAENGWDAKWITQSEYPTLESGQRTTSFFKAQNVGQRTWANSTVNLGTTAPRDRRSALWDTEAWGNYGRPTSLEEARVDPGQTGTFEFTVLAPDVTEKTTFREHFAPVADAPDGGWMEESWGAVYLDYTVTPRRAPTVRIAGAPQTVRSGDQIDVVAEARDDYAMRHVEFFLDGSKVATATPDGDDSFAASFRPEGIGAGTHVITARAIDHVGNETSVSHSFEVYEATPGQPPPPSVTPPIVADATMRARLLRRKRVRVLQLTVSAPVGSRIEVRCRPRRCRPQVVRSTRRRTTRIQGLRRVVLRRGTRVEIAVTRPGTQGELTRFTIGRRTIRKQRFPLGG
jgi:hypothetical protein